MLESAIGSHCELPECHQRDFMPFECQFCGDIFCGEHRRPDDHRCRVGGDRDQLYVIICPICELRIRQKANEDADQLWTKHSSSGECEREAKVKAERDRADAAQIQTCQVAGCKKRLTAISRRQCNKCMIETCMVHRLPETHSCKQTVTRDPRLAKSKLLQLNQKGASPQVAVAAQAAASSSQVNPVAATSSHNSNIAAMSGGFASSQRDIEEQKRLLTQFQFGGAVPSQPQTYGVSLPEICHVCQARFRDVMDLIAHSESAHPATNTTSASTMMSAGGAATQQQKPVSPKKETQRCTECGRSFALTELVTHMQQDHFIF